MSKPSVASRGRVLRGDAAALASSAAVLSSKLDGITPEERRPRTAADKLLFERTEAIREGYNDGLVKARAEVEAAMEDANKRVHRALAALCEAVDTFDTRQTIALADVEDAIAAGALAIASAILQREITASIDPGADAIARAMQLVPARGDVVARLNPDDVATLDMDHVSTSTRTVRVIGDPAIEIGGCIVDVGEARVDAQISSALDKVRTALMLSIELPIEQVPPLAMEYLTPLPAALSQPDAIAGSDAPSSRTTASEAPGA